MFSKRRNAKHFGSSTTLVFATIALLASPIVAQEDHIAKGMEQFRNGKIDSSIKSFEKAKTQKPLVSPSLWQLGISLYYAEKFEAGRKQFELHKTVNPNDVENATWHFICVARQPGNDVEAARESLIKIDTKRDRRVPMREIYEFYAGRGSADSVLAAANGSKYPAAKMYAHLYLGLYYEVAKQAHLAKKHMRLAAAEELTNHYMHDVAKVHVKIREWDQ